MVLSGGIHPERHPSLGLSSKRYVILCSMLCLAFSAGVVGRASSNASFQHRWSHSFGSANDFGYAIAVDAFGNVALTGSLYGPADFGGGPLTGAGGGDLFLAKFDTDGNHVWSKRFGDENIQNGLDVAFDRDGNVVITGYLFGSANFGGGPLVSAGADDILLVKLDPNGNHIWSKNFGGNNSFPNFERGESVVVDNLGSIFLAGTLGGTVNFGGGPRSGSVFLAKFDAAGNHLWSRAFGGALFQPKLAVDGAGNVVMTAKLRGTADFGGGPLTSAGDGFDVVLAKFASNGTHVLSRLFGDSSDQEPVDVATDPSGNILLAGFFSGTIDFGGSTITSAHPDDIFLAKLEPNGNHVWSRRFNGSGALYAVELWMTLGVDPLGDVVLAGAFDGTTDFGGGPLVESGGVDVFLAEWDPNGNHLISQKFGDLNLQWNIGSAVDSHGDVVITGNFNDSVDFGGGTLTPSDFRAMYLAKFLGAAPACNKVGFEFSPSTLNLRSRGRWVTASLEPDPPTSPADIDVASILLNGSVPVDGSAPTSIGDADHDGRPDLNVKFDRAAVELTVTEGESVPITVQGKIGSGCFEATGLIRVIRGRVLAPSAGSLLQGGSQTDVRWETPVGVEVQSVAVLWSGDDGASWKQEADHLPNTGSYLWTVPNANCARARVAVVVQSAGGSDEEVQGVLGVGGRFAIASVLGLSTPNVSFELYGPVPNPSRGLNVSFSLSRAEPARLIVYDLSGRQVSMREVGSLGPGRHVVSLSASGTLAPGVYLIQLVQGDRTLVTRAAVLR